MFIKRFLEKMTAIDGRQGRDLILSLDEARGLRDDLNQLLIDNYELSKTEKKEQVIQVEVTGGKW
jgi:hypothetical protein